MNGDLVRHLEMVYLPTLHSYLLNRKKISCSIYMATVIYIFTRSKRKCKGVAGYNGVRKKLNPVAPKTARCILLALLQYQDGDVSVH
jgi:hypothetical protein